jgi:hypothetical protein
MFGSSVLLPLETARLKRKLNQSSSFEQSGVLVTTYTSDNDDKEKCALKRRTLKTSNINDTSTLLSAVIIK